jgi:hypothetical protein
VISFATVAVYYCSKCAYVTALNEAAIIELLEKYPRFILNYTDLLTAQHYLNPFKGKTMKEFHRSLIPQK